MYHNNVILYIIHKWPKLEDLMLLKFLVCSCPLLQYIYPSLLILVSMKKTISLHWWNFCFYQNLDTIITSYNLCFQIFCFIFLDGFILLFLFIYLSILHDGILCNPDRPWILWNSRWSWSDSFSFTSIMLRLKAWATIPNLCIARD